MFSVLVPTYNHEPYVAAALDSLLAQTWTDWEAVVVNDGSTDGTARILAQYAQRDPRFRIFHKENGGVSSALNEGIRQARGRWICWLSSDDLFEPDALAIFEESIRKDPSCRFFHADFHELVHETGEKRLGPLDRAAGLPAEAFQTISFFNGNYIHGISVCIDRSLFDQAGGFDPALKYAQDMDMWLRLSALTPLRYLDRRLCITRVHAGMGTLGFPEACILDSARACLSFLNHHGFQELFPHVDLSNAEGVTQAIQAALRVALNTGACMYQGVGFVPALLERLEEWIFERCPPGFREALWTSMGELAGQSASLPKELRAPLIRMGNRQRSSYVVQDPVEAMKEHLKDALLKGNLAEGQLLRRYLEKVVGIGLLETHEEPPTHSTSGAGEAFLFEPDGSDLEWVEVVLSYVMAFSPGEPVALVLVPSQGTNPEVFQGDVLEVIARSGLDRFPDIVILDGHAELLQVLRKYRGFQWLPKGRGRVEGLKGPLGDRFAKARRRLVNGPV